MAYSEESPVAHPSELVLEYAQAAVDDDKHAATVALEGLVWNFARDENYDGLLHGVRNTYRSSEPEPNILRLFTLIYDHGVGVVGPLQAAHLIDIACLPLEISYERAFQSPRQSQYRTAGIVEEWQRRRWGKEINPKPHAPSAAEMKHRNSLTAIGYGVRFWRTRRNAAPTRLGEVRNRGYSSQFGEFVRRVKQWQ